MAAFTASRFTGRILGVGTQSGVRIVVGIWEDSPFGPFADVMLETASPDGGERVLLAPSVVAQYVAQTYHFDDVRVGPVSVVELPGPRRSAVSARLRVRAGELRLDVEVGRRTGLGWLLRGLPRAVATHPRWARAISPLAGALMPGVRTWGSAGGGRSEAYGAWDHRAVLRVRGTWRGHELRELAPLDPPVRFGFGSAPRGPSMVSIVSTVIEGGDG